MASDVLLPKESGTFGIWIPHGNGDVHCYVHNATHEGAGVIIGCNPTYESKQMRGTDPGLCFAADGETFLQFADDKGEIVHRTVDRKTAASAILKMLNELKEKVQ